MAVSSIRETCKGCGESHVTKVRGITPKGADYAVVVDSCIWCPQTQPNNDADE